MTLDDIFKPAGLLAQHFADYEQRIEQVKMATLVESAIATKYSAAIEGATGVGKSFAYLIPLILSGQRAIISTSNKSLQDQLSNKDLPALKEILKEQNVEWVVLKGKSNYFCHEHFKINKQEIMNVLYRHGYNKRDSELKLQEIAKWADTSKDGDVEYYPSELPIGIKELITCDTNTKHEKGSSYYDLCFANRARLAAQSARVILVNHTLLALDTSLRKETDGKAHILPDVPIVIIDEAHTFEHYAVMAFSDEISFRSLLHLLNWSIAKKSSTEKELAALSQAMRDNLSRFLPEKGKYGYYIQKKFPKFDGFETTIGLLQALTERVKHNNKIKNDEETQAKKREVLKEAENLIERLTALDTEDENMLRWSEAKDGRLGDVFIKLRSVPLDISELLKEGLFNTHTVICTSATLAVNGNFDFFRYQIGMPDTALQLAVLSPFNFKENALIYISPGQLEKYVEMQQLLEYSKGRAFILFTSYRDMEECYRIVDVPYPKLVQDGQTPRTKLLEQFKTTPNAVLFATRSFWEGVDVKGAQLSMVIIHKIPFETPSDIVYSSKIERIDKKFGVGKHWGKYTIPDACLKLKQGVGRLIRSTTDVGVIALLDARVNFRNYGKAVVSAMPPAYRTQKMEKVKAFFERKKV